VGQLIEQPGVVDHNPQSGAGLRLLLQHDLQEAGAQYLLHGLAEVIGKSGERSGLTCAQENLTVVPQRRKVAAEHHWSVERVFEFFPRLAERQSSMARSLSGGEQQMLAIGRALMTNPTLLVMDEPSEGLAPAILDVIQDRLEGLRKEGLGILLVEQNIDLALDIAERVLIIDDSGTICWEGLPSELVKDEALLEKHLSV
jgi:branched-chain amino acid transport system ATP-binding protein